MMEARVALVIDRSCFIANFVVDISWNTVARELRGLADMAENTAPDFMLFRVESHIERLYVSKTHSKKIVRHTHAPRFGVPRLLYVKAIEKKRVFSI